MKKEEKLKEERLAELLKKADGHPMMKAILAEEAAAILAKRTEAAGKIEVLKKEQEEVIPRLRADIDAKEGKYKEAKATLDVLFDELRTARAELSSRGYQFDNDIKLQEQILYESADPIIDETITFFREKLGELRKPWRISSRGMTVERNLFTDTKTITVETNKDAVLDALAYCQAAIKGLEALKLSPEFHIEGIQELKDGIPSIEVYTESTGVKPLPGSKGVNPLHLLPTDSEMDWKRDTLLEKAKKILKR